MRIEDMVEGLNKHIEAERVKRNIITDGHLVFQLSITQHPTIKAYKEYKAVVWFTKDRKNYKVAQVSQVAKVVDEQDKYIMRVINIDMSKTLFSLVSKSAFQEIIKGEFDGDSNE